MNEAVLFDLDDTLHDDTDAYRRAAADVAREVALECAVPAERVLAAYISEAERFWSTLSQDHLGAQLAGVRERMWSVALAATGIVDAQLSSRCAAAYIRYRKQYLKLWPGVADLLATLRSEGCKLGLITNGFAETHHEKIELLGLSESFDAIFIADEVGMVKPDPRLFAHACERLGVAPERAVMIGDRYHRDVTGAHAAGLRTIWLDIHGERIPSGGPLPDATVASIAQAGAALTVLRARRGRR
jgi:HAD superfamily hydrolase (TIGR02253 family)